MPSEHERRGWDDAVSQVDPCADHYMPPSAMDGCARCDGELDARTSDKPYVEGCARCEYDRGFDEGMGK